jgi:murein DD-endopeptidase MepM/ murein hydrolase activator NlpD
MKRIILAMLLFGFISFASHSFAYDECNFSNPFVPCSYNGFDFDGFVGNSLTDNGASRVFFNSQLMTVVDFHAYDDTYTRFYDPLYGYACMYVNSGTFPYWQETPQFFGESCVSHNLGYYGLGAGIPATASLTITRSPEAGGDIEVNEIPCSSCPCQFQIALNAEAEAIATPATGYAFAYWLEGEVQYTDNPHTFVMSEGRSVTAVFYLKADSFIFPVLADGVTDPLLNTGDPVGDGWHGPGIGEHSAHDGHLGQDYVFDSGSSAGKPVYAVANGTIVEVMNNQNTSYGWCDNDDHGWGPVIVIRHENHDGFNTTDSIVTTSCSTETNPTVIYSLYGHLSKTSIATLQVGQTVTRGQQIGTIGSYNVDQNSWTTNHLHFELKDEVGFNEGTWYTAEINEGVCPEPTNYNCGTQLIKGVGTAYSEGDGFAPHRYLPGIFIPAN